MPGGGVQPGAVPGMENPLHKDLLSKCLKSEQDKPRSHLLLPDSFKLCTSGGIFRLEDACYFLKLHRKESSVLNILSCIISNFLIVVCTKYNHVNIFSLQEN